MLTNVRKCIVTSNILGFKIGSEVVESIWDAVLELNPELQNPMTPWKKRRHSSNRKMWHPLSEWVMCCKSNLLRSIENAEAIFIEHKKRKGTIHSAWDDLAIIKKNIDKTNYSSENWEIWCKKQKSRLKFDSNDVKLLRFRIKVLRVCSSLDRNKINMTRPALRINAKQFPDIDKTVNGGIFDFDLREIVNIYRKYYIAKRKTISGGMRFYYTQSPSWLDKS